MMLWLTALLLGLTQASFFGERSGVRELSTGNFKQRVLYDGNLTAVVFYAPWCGYCQKLAPHWAKVAKELRGIANIAAVNCDLGVNQELCSKFKVKGYPTIKVVQPAKLTDVDFKDAVENKKLPHRRPKIFDYNGPHEAQDITKFIVPKLRNYVATLSSDDALLWMAPNKIPRVILLPGKKYKSVQIPPLLKVLSREYFGKIRFATIPRRIDGAWNLLGMEAVDESHLVYMSDDKQPVVYKGSMKKRAVKKFLDEQYELEMARRKHLNIDMTPSRDSAANGLEFVVEDSQKSKLEHVAQREELVKKEKKLAREAKEAAFERLGKTLPAEEDDTDSETLTLKPIIVNMPSNIPDIEEGGVIVEDFEFNGTNDTEVADYSHDEPEVDLNDEDVSLDSTITEVTADLIVQEGPEAVAEFLSQYNLKMSDIENELAKEEANKHKTRTGPAPAKATARGNNTRIDKYDKFVQKCLRSGYNCAVMVTTSATRDSDLITLIKVLQKLPKKIKTETIFEWILRNDNEEIDGFLQDIELNNTPGLFWHDFGRQKMHIYNKGWSIKELDTYIRDIFERKVDLDRTLPAKYKYWVTKEEVEAQLKEEEEKRKQGEEKPKLEEKLRLENLKQEEKQRLEEEKLIKSEL